MRLYLIGPRGAGKTTIGRTLARRAGVRLVDTDEQIEHRAGARVSELFAGAGEAAFRRLERELFAELFTAPDDPRGVVVSTGGGCVVDDVVREALRRAPHVVWLTARPELLAARVAGSDRPSLTGAHPAVELATVVARRAPLYRCCAKLCLDTSTLSVCEAVDVIQHFWSPPAHHLLR